MFFLDLDQILMLSKLRVGMLRLSRKKTKKPGAGMGAPRMQNFNHPIINFLPIIGSCPYPFGTLPNWNARVAAFLLRILVAAIRNFCFLTRNEIDEPCRGHTDLFSHGQSMAERFCQNTKALHDRATIFRPSEKTSLIPIENKRFYGNGEYLTSN